MNITEVKMSNFDPCECVDIMNHENAMQRLINMVGEQFIIDVSE